MNKKSSDKTELLTRKINVMNRSHEQYIAYNKRVERKLWQKELRLYGHNYVISNQAQEIKALKDRIERLESSKAIRLARKLKGQLNKWTLRGANNEKETLRTTTYNIDTNAAAMWAMAERVNRNPKRNRIEELWCRQLPQKQIVNQFKDELLHKNDMPTISILLPVFNIGGIWLKQAILSVLGQIYPKWELCIVDDASNNAETLEALKQFEAFDERIKIEYQNENCGISHTSDHALSMTTGEYITFLDHDDYLSPNALFEVYQTIRTKDADFIYSDEAIVNPRNKIVNVFLKPDYSPDFLLSMNYINHLTVVRKDLIDQSGGFRPGIDGAQDYDLVLKTTEIAKKICHIQKILYFWRHSTGTFSASDENKKRVHDIGRRAIEYALQRRKVDAKVYDAKRTYNYYVKRKIHQKPKVSIIIPFKDKFELLEKCLESVIFKTHYENYEIIGIDHESSRIETLDGMQFFEKMDERIRFYHFKGDFNYSKINNYGVANATGEQIVLMNSDIEVINSDWLETLLEHSQRKSVGAVGGKLYYPDNTIQHAGVVLGISGIAGHSYRKSPREADGMLNRLTTIQNVSAVTGALLMVKKSLYNDVGGLDEINLKIALNDVDFCLKLREKNYLNVFTPYCEAYHYESLTRGYDLTLKKKRKFEEERNFMIRKWKNELKLDPYYNKHLTLEREDYTFKNGSELRTMVKPIY